MVDPKMAHPKCDYDRHRLRTFVEQLQHDSELEVHHEPVALVDMSAMLERSGKAVLFRDAGPEHLEVVGGVSGSRRRLGLAFEADERQLAAQVLARLADPQPLVEVTSAEAPIHELVQTGDQIDLTTLPFHLQHERDGGCYISAGLDFTVDPDSGTRNVGARRLMLRGRRQMRTNLTDNSDLKRIYKAQVARGERLPVAFVIGHHPCDFFASGLKIPGDELQLLANVRAGPTPIVKCVSNDICVPADCELVIEGYIDEHGYREMDGPYGEFWGYYGAMHIDPVIEVTAITMRRDALHQTVVHGPQQLARQEASHTASVAAEMVATLALRKAGIEPHAIHSPPNAPLFHRLRIALSDATPEAARAAINAVFAIRGMKHIVVVDDDIDVFDDDQVTWAMSTRFDPAHDLVTSEQKMAAFYADPLADPDGRATKLGFDLTHGSAKSSEIRYQRPRPPAIVRSKTNASVRQALEAGPKFFVDLMAAVGSDDGREVAIELDALRCANELTRLEDGKYALMAQVPDRPRVV